MDTIDTNEIRFTMRMESDLYERIKEAAKKNKRSIAKEIEYQLEQYQLFEEGLIPPSIRELMSEYTRKIDEHEKQVQKLYKQICMHDELLEIAKERFKEGKSD